MGGTSAAPVGAGAGTGGGAGVDTLVGFTDAGTGVLTPVRGEEVVDVVVVVGADLARVSPEGAMVTGFAGS